MGCRSSLQLVCHPAGCLLHRAATFGYLLMTSAAAMM